MNELQVTQRTQAARAHRLTGCSAAARRLQVSSRCRYDPEVMRHAIETVRRCAMAPQHRRRGRQASSVGRLLGPANVACAAARTPDRTCSTSIHHPAAARCCRGPAAALRPPDPMEAVGADVVTTLVLMFVGALVCGALPYAVRVRETHLQAVAALGAGLLIGSALAVIIPEGFHAFAQARARRTGTVQRLPPPPPPPLPPARTWPPIHPDPSLTRSRLPNPHAPAGDCALARRP